VDSLCPTPTRRRQLRVSKHFDCCCRRCSDPSELGTHLSSLSCPKCARFGAPETDVVSVDPLDDSAPWMCPTCGVTVPVERVYTIMDEIGTHNNCKGKNYVIKT